MTIRVFATPLAAQFDNNSGLVVVPPPPFPAQRAYVSTVGTPIDVTGDMAGDAGMLVNQGYVALGTSGPTTSRPTGSNLRTGALHIDTTLNAAVIWDGANWRNPITGASV